MMRFRVLLLRLLILVLIVRAGVPAGYMPDPAALQDGVLRMVICTANGPQELTVAASDHAAGQDADSGPSDSRAPAPHSDPPARHASCVFAVAAQPLIDAPGVAVAALTPPDTAPVLPALAAPRPDWRSSSRQPRAPPSPSFA